MKRMAALERAGLRQTCPHKVKERVEMPTPLVAKRVASHKAGSATDTPST